MKHISNPIASFILPVYNGQKYLKKTIESVLNQSIHDFELIIIDDGSTDKTHDIIKQFNDFRIKYYKNEFNIGLIKTLNIGVKLANGEYILRIDADDICTPRRLEYQIEFMKRHPSYIASGGCAKIINGEKINFLNWNVPLETIKCKTYSLFGNPFIHSTIIIDRKRFQDKNLLYSSEFKHAEDYALWFGMLHNDIEMGNSSEVLTYYRIHENNISITAEENIHERIEVLKRINFETLKKYSDKINSDIYLSHYIFSNFDRNLKISFKNFNSLISYYNSLISNPLFKNNYSTIYFKLIVTYFAVMNCIKGKINPLSIIFTLWKII